MPLSYSGCPLSLKTPNMGNPGSMVLHLDPSDERYTDTARGILRRHDLNEAEANITSAIRDFLILTNLAKSDEIVEEKAPALGARTAVDLTALDTFVEIKRRIGTTPGFDPDPDNVEQLDGYLEHSEKEDWADGREALAAPVAGRGRGQDDLPVRIHPGESRRVASALRMAARQGPGVEGRHPSGQGERGRSLWPRQPTLPQGHSPPERTVRQEQGL